MSRTITEGSVDLDKFPASRVWQLAKKFESSKATVHHIKQVAGDLHTTQINLIRHQRTELPTNRHNKKRRPTSKAKLYKTLESPLTNQVKKLMTVEKHIRCLTTVINVVTPFMCRDSNALQRSTNAKYATNMATFQVYAIKRRLKCITRTVTETPKHINFMQVQCMCRTVPVTVIQTFQLWWVIFLQLQIQSNHAEAKQIPNAVHLIMNLAYWLKPQHTRNMYLWAWLDTCANVNIMLASVYWPVFKDLEMRKIKPCKMQISTYTADTAKIIGSCTFGIVHLDTKKLVPVTFYVANNDGNILLSCKTTLALCLIQPWSRLDYLPPWASLIATTMDHPRKTKLTSLKVHRSKQEVSAQRQEPQSHDMMSMSTDIT